MLLNFILATLDIVLVGTSTSQISKDDFLLPFQNHLPHPVPVEDQLQGVLGAVGSENVDDRCLESLGEKKLEIAEPI